MSWSKWQSYFSRNVLFDETLFPFSKHNVQASFLPQTSCPSLSQNENLVTTVSVPINQSQTMPISPSIEPQQQNNELHDPISETRQTEPSSQPINTHNMQTRSKSRLFKPKVYTAAKEPTTIKEVLTTWALEVSYERWIYGLVKK